MSIGSQLRRTGRYVKAQGLAGFLRRCAQILWRSTLGSKVALFCHEPAEDERDAPRQPEGHAVVRCRRREGLSESDAETLVAQRGRYRGRDAVERYLKARFIKGAELWLLKVNDRIACFVWSTRGAMVSPFYVPLTANDVVVFDIETFSEFRGRGFAGSLTAHVVASLAKEGARRFYMTVKLWNGPSLQALRKTKFNRVATARKFSLLGRNITIWRKE